LWVKTDTPFIFCLENQKEILMSTTSIPTRRSFLKTAAGAASFSILPSHMLWGADAPSEQFRFAQIGCGGKGWGDMKSTMGSGGKLVAMCDVDKARAGNALKNHGDVPMYADYRVLLDKHDNDIDGIVVSTPDHMHACIALEAIKRGKHVYVQKPLARTYQECSVLLAAAKKHGVVTQMGNQGHSGDGLKLWSQMQEEKAFGDILQVNTWSNRPIWPQGMTKLPAPEKAPDNLAWDLWLGPAAKRAYSKEYVPFKWRGWWDFGAGAMGDMACHNMDPAFWIFELGMPNKIKAQASAPAGITYPEWSIIEYTFDHSPVTGKPIKLTWYDGPKRPDMPAGAHESLKPGSNGCMVVGSKMTVMGGSHASRPLPIALAGQDFGPAVKDAEKHWRAESKKHKGDNHYGQWIAAAKAGDPNAPGSKFDYAVPFTQSILLGCLALRFPGEELVWDDKKQQFSNHSEANKWLAAEPRKGYSLSL
jgi:predicted dehydrogenase